MVEWARFFVFAGFSFLIGLEDFRTQRIPNILLFLMLCALVLIDALWNRGIILFNFSACLFAFGVFYAVYRLQGGLGFGDVKYAGVIGYFLGLERAAGGLLCGVLLGLLYWFIGSLFFRWNKSRRFPFGPWMGAGAAAALLIHRGIL